MLCEIIFNSLPLFIIELIHLYCCFHFHLLVNYNQAFKYFHVCLNLVEAGCSIEMHLLTITFLLGISLYNILSQESFLLAFQNSKELSSSEWAEYDGKILHLKAFTCCHWEKLHFFNTKSHYIWNYCTIKNSSDKMECMQMWYKRDKISAGRDIIVGISFGRGNIGYVTIKPFNHRSWNHFCWSYESSSGENKIYVNGKFYGNIFFDIKREALGSDEVYGSSFSVGQEPDSFRGKYDAGQAYRGNISEINLWDFVLSEDAVEDIGLCRERARGNVIKWEKSKFKLYNITWDRIEDVSKFCTPEKNIFVFPEKYSLPSAISLCQYHGGYLFTPTSQEENAKLAAEVATYEAKCNTNGNVFWLGSITEDFLLISRDANQNLIRGNYTNWNSPLFESENACVYMKTNAKWMAYSDCEFLELCPVCGFIGTPVLTLKGKLSISGSS